MDAEFVVVVTEGERVISVLGPRDERAAKALSEVIRLGPDRKATVMPVRDADVIDMHGPEVLAPLGEAVEAMR